MAKTERHQWAFRTRFRRNAFGWKSQPAIKRIKEAVSEIKKVGRKDPVLAAERHEELLGLLEMAPYKMWHYRSYGVKALAAEGKKAKHAGVADKTRQRIRDLVAKETSGERFVSKALRGHLGIS